MNSGKDCQNNWKEIQNILERKSEWHLINMIKFYFFFTYFFSIVFINFKYTLFHIIIAPPIFGKIFNILITNNYCTPNFSEKFSIFSITHKAPSTKFFIFSFFSLYVNTVFSKNIKKNFS